MFKSATVKLTASYLLILMCISVLFSVIIYQVALSEIATRLEHMQLTVIEESDLSLLPHYDLSSLRRLQAHEAASNLFVGLFYANVLILIAGGIGSYLLARRSLEPIERLHEAQSRFTSDASHEFRTPLAAMKTELEVVLRDPEAKKSELRDVLESNLEEVNKLTRLSHTLLQLSRLDYASLKPTRVPLEELLTEIVARHEKNNRDFGISPHKKPLIISAHRDSIEELFSILIDNAIKYSTENSAIDIRVSKQSKRAQVTIANNGPGIAPENIPHVFDRFYRADGSRTGGEKSGYGLGLSLAKKIVEIHHGEISITSTPGKMTTVTVNLPLNFSQKTAES